MSIDTTYQNEKWMPVKGFEELYMVSNMGRVKSIDRTQTYNDARGFVMNRSRKGVIRVLHHNPSTNYMQVMLSNGKYKMTTVHRLVAQAFLPNEEGHSDVNHINGNKIDNRVENLEWCSHKDNMHHAISKGLLTQLRGEKSNLSKLKESDVIEIVDFAKNNPHLLQREVGKKFGISQAQVSRIMRGANWAHLNLNKGDK